MAAHSIEDRTLYDAERLVAIAIQDLEKEVGDGVALARQRCELANERLRELEAGIKAIDAALALSKRGLAEALKPLKENASVRNLGNAIEELLLKGDLISATRALLDDSARLVEQYQRTGPRYLAIAGRLGDLERTIGSARRTAQWTRRRLQLSKALLSIAGVAGAYWLEKTITGLLESWLQQLIPDWASMVMFVGLSVVTVMLIETPSSAWQRRHWWKTIDLVRKRKDALLSQLPGIEADLSALATELGPPTGSFRSASEEGHHTRI